MKMARENQTLDAIADPEDLIDIRIQKQIAGDALVLYVDVNGVTVLRIGGIKKEVEVTRAD